MVMDWDFVVRPKMQTLSSKEVEYFFSRSLEVLEKIGVRVMHPEALELLRNAGASISDNFVVRIKPALVEEAIRFVPKKLVIYNREGRAAMELGGSNTGGNNTYYGTGSDLPNTYDPYTGEMRLTVAKDIANMAKVVDFLPNLDFIMSFGIPYDVPLDKVYPVEFLQMVTNTVKPIVFTSDNGAVSKKIIEMAALLVGGMDKLRERPFIINYSQPTSPLQHSDDALGKMFACAEAGVPVVYPPGMIPGATAPVTIAGAVTQSLAEAFSALVIHQLKGKGAPIILCGAHGCMDMRSSINAYAAPERLMTEAALSSVYQNFGIPTWGFGGCSDAAVLDEQAGAEFGMMSMWASLCGINLAHDTGYLGSGLIGDLRAVVMNDEINGYVRHILCSGMRVNRENVAIDVMEQVGPGGNYLFEEHTYNKFKTALWMPKLMNRNNISTWREKGSKPLRDILGEKLRDILEKHEPKELDKGIISKLERIVFER